MTNSIPVHRFAERQAHMRPVAQGANPFGVVFGRLLRPIRRAWTQHRDEKLLEALSDYQLRDIGISRLQIPQVIRRGWDI